LFDAAGLVVGFGAMEGRAVELRVLLMVIRNLALALDFDFTPRAVNPACQADLRRAAQ
jgi:hypothetical protein